jgi:dTDP-4-dehydrorhamnose 3,5-epimerase
MQVLNELLPGCALVQPKTFEDARGSFVKTYHAELCATLGIALELREEFYSVSHRGVLRGMHFQLPPHAHDKLVFCVHGAVRDVLLDLRRGPHYGRVATAELSAENRQMVFIPKGVAHGFLALTEGCVMLYKTSTVHTPASDCGIRWDSFGYDWAADAPLLSERDRGHARLQDFHSPF